MPFYLELFSCLHPVPFEGWSEVVHRSLQHRERLADLLSLSCAASGVVHRDEQLLYKHRVERSILLPSQLPVTFGFSAVVVDAQFNLFAAF